jgi:hypothetical protein
MDEPRTPKAVRQGYDVDPFFFREWNGPDTRIVAWTASPGQLRDLLHAVTNRFPEELEVLLKAHDLGADERDAWERWGGDCSRADVLDAFVTHEHFVTQDGASQVCVKRPDTGEYFALDDHGILFIYSPDPSFEGILEAMGFVRAREPLIFEGGHWHKHLKDHTVLRDRFITGLGLRWIDRDDGIKRIVH